MITITDDTQHRAGAQRGARAVTSVSRIDADAAAGGCRCPSSCSGVGVDGVERVFANAIVRARAHGW